MPPIGLALGKVDFANLFVSLNGIHYDTLAAAQAAGAPTVNYGTFINTVISFLIFAFVIFLLVRKVNAMRSKPTPPAPNTKDCPYCKENISLSASRCPHCIGSWFCKDHLDDLVSNARRKEMYLLSEHIYAAKKGYDQKEARPSSVKGAISIPPGTFTTRKISPSGRSRPGKMPVSLSP